MPLKRIEFQTFESVSSVAITPEEGEAWRVFRISVVGGSENDTMEVKIGKTSVFYAPVKLGGKDLFSLPGEGQTYANLFDVLKEIGHPIKFPVTTGKQFTITLSFTATLVKVEYEVYDANDVRKDEPNGEEANISTILGWVANSSAVTESGYVTLDKSKLPAEYPDFPALAVPSNAKAKVFAVAVRAVAGSVGDGTATTGTSYTEYTRLFYRRKVLFDPNRVGWVTKGDSTYAETGTTMTFDYDAEINECPVIPKLGGSIMVIDPVIEVPAGEELNVQVKVAHTSGVDLPAESIQAIVFYTLEIGR